MAAAVAGAVSAKVAVEILRDLVSDQARRLAAASKTLDYLLSSAEYR